MRADVKLFCGLVLVIAVVQAFPADPRIQEFHPKFGRVQLEKDAEELPPGLPDGSPYGFLGGINDLFDRMRQQMLYLMTHVPRIGFGTPEGGNTTSVTKIIDGHKVVINETVYTSGDGEDAAAVFKVRVVDIHPDSEGEVGYPSAPSDGPKTSVESLEVSHENEIPKSGKVHHQKRKVNSIDYMEDENNFNNMETFDEPDNMGLEAFDLEGVPNNDLETFDEDVHDKEEEVENDIELFDHEVDLSNDILVNKIAEENGRPHNPDAEFLPGYYNSNNFHSSHSSHSPQPPRDLSRDIYINEIAKNFGRPQNPDAEVFDPSLPYSVNNDNNVYDLSRDTYVNEIGNLPMNPDAEFIHPFPKSRYYYRTEDS